MESYPLSDLKREEKKHSSLAGIGCLSGRLCRRSLPLDPSPLPQIIFDECHKAKNATSTKMGKAVLDLQNKLPQARVVYASATGTLTDPRPPNSQLSFKTNQRAHPRL